MLNPLTTNIPNHIETSQLIYPDNQFTGFYMRDALVVKGLRKKNKALNTQETLFASAFVACQYYFVTNVSGPMLTLFTFHF